MFQSEWKNIRFSSGVVINEDWPKSTQYLKLHTFRETFQNKFECLETQIKGATNWKNDVSKLTKLIEFSYDLEITKC